MLRPGGWLQFADIANGRAVAHEARRDVDPGSSCIDGGRPRAGWQTMRERARFTDAVIGRLVAAFAGAEGGPNARPLEVLGFALPARGP